VDAALPDIRQLHLNSWIAEGSPVGEGFRF